MSSLEGKVAYITGGTLGIGLGIAKALLAEGIKVAISSRNEDHVSEAVTELNDSESVLGIVSDVTDFQDEQRAIAAILEKWNSLDILIANAGIGHFAPIDELTPSDWHAMIDTNLTGVYHTLKAGVDALKSSKGYFISIASLAGANFFAQGAGYNATKFGLVGFTQAAMLDLRRYDIKVSTIMPGSVASYFRGNIPSQKDSWKIQPEDIGQIVVDLLNIPARTLPSKIEVRPSRPDLK